MIQYIELFKMYAFSVPFSSSDFRQSHLCVLNDNSVSHAVREILS